MYFRQLHGTIGSYYVVSRLVIQAKALKDLHLISHPVPGQSRQSQSYCRWAVHSDIESYRPRASLW